MGPCNPFFLKLLTGSWHLTCVYSCGVTDEGTQKTMPHPWHFIQEDPYEKVSPSWVMVGWPGKYSPADQRGRLLLRIGVAGGLKAWPPAFEDPPSRGPWIDTLSRSLPIPETGSQPNPTWDPKWTATTRHWGMDQTEKPSLEEKGEVLLLHFPQGDSWRRHKALQGGREGAPMDKALLFFQSPEQGLSTGLP